jgi:hypothetical protein
MPTTMTQVIEGVRDLAWQSGRQCTFLGALEAALAVTPHSTDYVDLMGFTALAFRTRWWKANEKASWCPSSPVGEMDEEIAAADRASGWPLVQRFPYSEEERKSGAGEIVASIDAGRPVLAYDSGLNLGVVSGYDDDGKALQFKTYRGEISVEPAKLGWFWIFLGDYHGRPDVKQSVTAGLRQAVLNFNRVTARFGPGEYWYGRAAIERWIADLSDVSNFTEEQHRTLFFVSHWNFTSMADARRAAATFLSRHVDSPPPAFAEEADLLEDVTGSKDAFLGAWTGKTFEDWDDDVRRRECEVLRRALGMEERGFASLAQLVSV